jgi:hypothetical protein
MNPKKAARALAAMTTPLCGEPCGVVDEHRCCQRVFCMLVKRAAEIAGVDLPPETGHDIPFMGESGCVVDPTLRPGCTAYLCPAHEKRLSRSERRKLGRLRRALMGDEGIRKLAEANDVAAKEPEIARALEEFGRS